MSTPSEEHPSSFDGKDSSADPLRELIRSQATRHPLPTDLKASILTRVALEQARQSASAHTAPTRPFREVRSARWLRFFQSPVYAASGGFVAGVAACVLLVLIQPAGMRRLSSWASSFGGASEPRALGVSRSDNPWVVAHVRALSQGPLMQVISTNRHTVKPWFQGKLDYAPPVADLSESGFVLAGARIDHLDQAPAATLVYRYHEHIISLGILPADEETSLQRSQHRGFQAWSWASRGMSYHLVTDMGEPETSAFYQAWVQAWSRSTVGAKP